MMCKAPDKSKITTFLRQCLTSTSAKADLSALYSPSDLSVEQVELEDMRTYHVYARCNLPHGVCPYCGHVSRSVHSRYHRTIADLSILGIRLSSRLRRASSFVTIRIVGKRLSLNNQGMRCSDTDGGRGVVRWL